MDRSAVRIFAVVCVVFFLLLCAAFDAAGERAEGSSVAVIGTRHMQQWQERDRRIDRGFPDYQYIPWEFLHLMDLSADDYGLVIVFCPTGSQEQGLPPAGFEKVAGYLDAGGQALVFLHGTIGDRVEELFIRSIGAGTLGRGRDNPDHLSGIVWEDHDGTPLRMANNPCGRMQWFNAITEPEADGAEVTARWVDYQGEIRSPAVVRAPYGYLFNINHHGDAQGIVLDAMVELAPWLGADIFSSLREEYAETEEYAFASEVIDASPEGRAMLAEAQALKSSGEAAADRGDFAAANRLIAEAERKLVRSYAVSMPSVPEEERMVSLTVRELPDPGIVIPRLAKAGFTNVRFHFRPGFYPSPLVDIEAETDWLKKWVDTGHAHGMTIGPVIAPAYVFHGEKTYERAVEEDWRVVPDYGREREPITGSPYRVEVCRARPEFIEHVVEKVSGIVEKYAVGQIMFDVIRWRGTCYCDVCRERFQEDTGLEIGEWPYEVLTQYPDEFRDWRAGIIKEIVRRSSEAVKGINPEVDMAVCVRSQRSSNLREGQYWWEWDDYVDWIAAMYYTPDIEGLKELLVRLKSSLPEDKTARTFPILNPMNTDRSGKNIVHLRQIDLQREHAPAAISYWNAHAICDDFLELLRIGPFRNRR